MYLDQAEIFVLGSLCKTRSDLDPSALFNSA